jgi:hypothetical protein
MVSTMENLGDLAHHLLGLGAGIGAGMISTATETEIAIVIVTVTAVTERMVTAMATGHLDPRLLPPGNSRSSSSILLLEHRADILVMLPMAATLLLLAWARLRDFPKLVLDWQLLPAWLE